MTRQTDYVCELKKYRAYYSMLIQSISVKNNITALLHIATRYYLVKTVPTSVKVKQMFNDPSITVTMLHVQYGITQFRFRNRLLQCNKGLDEQQSNTD